MRPIEKLSDTLKRWQESLRLPGFLLSEAARIALSGSEDYDPDSMAKERAIASLLLYAFNRPIGPITTDDTIVKFATSKSSSIRYGLMVAGFHLSEAGEAERSGIIRNILRHDPDPEIQYIASLMAEQAVADQPAGQPVALTPEGVTY